MQGNACVFVDGENLRHSLVELLKDTRFSARDYLPEANWADLFDWVVHEATDGACTRLRTYWYVIDEVDFHPWGLERLQRTDKGKLKIILSRNPEFRQKLKGLQDDVLDEELARIVPLLTDRRRKIRSRFDGHKRVQEGIQLTNRAITFRRSGAIKYNLMDESLGEEKTVDVSLACDMVTLQGIYEAAVIVSGDQDYVPAAKHIQDAGKTVINVAFKKRNGDLLPGGARRLNIACDHSVAVPYDELVRHINKL